MNKPDCIEDLQEILQEIFLNNLIFFKQHHPLIYNKVVEFEKLNIENFCLDFVNNEFQLLDLHNKKDFYINEPFSDALNRVNNFDLGSAFSLIKLESFEKRNHYQNEINAYLYLNQFIDNFQDINIKLNKFIFIGTLLGIHINNFHKILNAKTYLIIEPNIEIFRLSMFMTDYKVLTTNSEVFFAVSEDELTLKKTVTDFLEFKFEFNNLIHYELAHKINEPIINQLSLIFTHLGEMRYPFSDYLISLDRCHTHIIKNKNNLLNLSKTYNFLENKNVLFLGAGPSLEKHLDYIYLNRDNFIIVAVAATLKTLEIRNIIPDIIITVDGQEVVLEQFKVNKLIYENSIILSSIKLDKKVYTLLKNTEIYFFQDSLNLFENLGFITGVTVGDMGIDILLRFGIKNLYLLGIDAAIDSKTGRSHTNMHISLKEIDLDNKTIDNQINFEKTIVYVKGNLEKEVPTFLEYKEMIEEIDDKFKYLNNKFRIYNLSDGAYFKNTIPIRTHEISVQMNIDKIFFKKEFIEQLNNISKQKFNYKDMESSKIENEILENLSPLKDLCLIETFQQFQKTYPNSIIINILDKYFKLILPYYNFIGNKTISNKILNTQLQEILVKFNSLF